MGQYYTPIIKRGKKLEGYCSHHYNTGLKLVEHAYINNCFTETVMAELFDNPGRLAWVGDYAEENDVKSEFASEFIQAERNFQEKDYSRPESSKSKYQYVINCDKKEYIDIKKYCKIFDKEDYVILHPVPLLTAIGNGKGGGDYFGSNMEMIGSWACDTIMVTNSLGEETKNYIDITENLIFE